MYNRYIEGWTKYQSPHPFRQEAERLVELFNTNTYKIDGVIRWKSNNAIPPQDVLEFWRFIGKRFNMVKSIAARKRDEKVVIDRYKKNKKILSEEEQYNMRSAFGSGVDVVDVINGKKYKT